MLVKGAESACLPLTSARGCATPGCTNFLTGAFPARGEKAVYGPRAASGGGPAPAKASAPRARGAGRARGARTICTNQSPEKQQGQHRAPGKHRPRSRAANFGGLAPGRGARRPPSGRPFNAAPSSNGGSGGSPMWGDPPRAPRLPGDGPGGTRSESRNHRHRPAASERAAQRARAPPTRRIRLRRGFVEGSCCSIRCAAAWRPVVHALPRILPPDYSWVRSSAWEMMLHAASQPCT